MNESSSEPQGFGFQLLPQHEALLVASGILPEVATARGYRSIERKSDLESKGFSRAQRNVPGLLIPIYNVMGEFSTYQYRPDEPRVDGSGKVIKYETPHGSRMVLDVPLPARAHLADPGVPLFITEGSRKADSAVSRGLCCIALLGVWNFRGTNEYGGKIALPDWESIALNGRKVYIVFDSDVMTKPSVHKALARLKAFLEQRDSVVHLIYLPPAKDGSKVGLDDFLVSGNTVSDLLALATSDLRNTVTSDNEDVAPYRLTGQGLVWMKPVQDGTVPVTLTNFGARIVADVAEDDGVEAHRLFQIEATLHGRMKTFSIPVEKFASMSWATEFLGASAIVSPGFGLKDHARAAVQYISRDVPECHVFTHTGWRQIDGDWVYLHSDGAIGANGLINCVVRLAGGLSRYALVEPPSADAAREAVRASLRLLGVAPLEITLPLFAAIFRAVLGEVDFTLHLAGPTGAGKSEIAALIQQHFGPTMDARHLPGSWSSTGNAIEGIAFQVKDAVLVIDDFAPAGTAADIQRMHRDADRVFRAQGNQAGRQRMTASATLRPSKPPRGLIVSTGEDVPKGQSLRARSVVVEVGPNDVRWNQMTRCQRHAADGLYSQTLAGYVQWLAPRYEELIRRVRGQMSRLRQLAHRNGQHRRTPEIVVNLHLGLRTFLRYAMDIGAIAPNQAYRLRHEWWNALGAVAAKQAQYQADSEPTRRFLELLRAAIAGGSAHVAATDGGAPASASSWGWRSHTLGTGEYERLEWREQGKRVGWVDGGELYLQFDVAFATVQQIGSNTGDSISLTPQVMKKRLKERGLLASMDEARQTLSVRRMIEGKRQDVLHLHVDTLFGDKKPDQPDHTESEGAKAKSGRKSGRENGRTSARVVTANAAGTPDGLSERERQDNGTLQVSTPKSKETVRDPEAAVDHPDSGRVGQVFLPNEVAYSEEHVVRGGVRPDSTENPTRDLPTNAQEPAEVFSLAQQADFPEVHLAPHIRTVPTREGWQKFCRTAPPNDLETARQELESLLAKSPE